VRFVQERVALCTGFKARGLFAQSQCIGRQTLGK
jgi:hypothetical protein